jgi:hypothetical protein
MNIEEQRDTIIDQLEMLNTKMAQQNSIKHIFLTGVIYGVGFFIGSVILATIAFGITSPFFGKIDWIRDNFERGALLR